MPPLTHELATSLPHTSLRLRNANRAQPRWLHQSSRLAAVICIAAAALVSPGLNSKASAQAADQPLPIWSLFDDLLAKCFGFFAPPPGPPVGPPPPPGPGPDMPSPLFPSPLFPTPVVIIPLPPPGTPLTPVTPGPPPEPIAVPGPVAGAGLPALLLLGAAVWFRRREAQRGGKQCPFRPVV
jgi:hypothetical protein